MGDVNITYETLFELLRLEKTREDLQKLDPGFFNDVLGYLQEKKAQLETLKTKDDLFAAEEKKKADLQDDNIKKILREFYERREKKILTMAVDKSRTSESVVDTSALLAEERVLYDDMVKLLDSFRRGILFNLLEANGIDVVVPEQPKEESDSKEESSEAKEGVKRIKITEFVPKFVGTDLEEYGPYDNEDTAELPEDVAEMLIDKGSAEEVY